MRELNFFEAMKAADEGKVVVSRRYRYRYKKDFRGVLVMESHGDWRSLPIYKEEINDSWTIEEPVPKLPIKFECFGSGNYYTDEHKRIDQIIDIVAVLQKQIKELKGER